MKALLDTHSFLWFINGDSKLSPVARSIIEDDTNERFLSVASLWEMAIKISIGKLKLSSSFEVLIPEQLNRNGIELLDISREHASLVSKLPFHHRDPFDRMILAQAVIHQMAVISFDNVFDNYHIQRIW